MILDDIESFKRIHEKFPRSRNQETSNLGSLDGVTLNRNSCSGAIKNDEVLTKCFLCNSFNAELVFF